MAIIDVSDRPILATPAGAVNASSRSQTREKYVSDFIRGQRAEWVAAVHLRSEGLDPTVSDPDIRCQQNLHDPDLIGKYSYHVKSVSTFGGVESVVRMLGRDHVLVVVRMLDENRGFVQNILFWDVAMLRLEGMLSAKLKTKTALYL